MKVLDKDPDALLDYGFNWGPWLTDGDTIDNLTVTVPAGLIKDRAETFTPEGIVVVWLRGGTVGQAYRVVFNVHTTQGRDDERSLILRITDR